MKILVVDDDVDILPMVAQLLRNEGYEVVAVDRGVKAFYEYYKALVEERPFDVLLLDGALPDIPGTRVGSNIRNIEEFSGIPRARHVYFTAHDDLITDELRERTKPDAYIMKSCDPEELLDAISGAI